MVIESNNHLIFILVKVLILNQGDFLSFLKYLVISIAETFTKPKKKQILLVTYIKLMAKDVYVLMNQKMTKTINFKLVY